MAEYHFPVPGSVDEAKIVLFVRRHWASFIGQFLLSFFILVVPVVILLVLYFSQIEIPRGVVLNFMVLGFSIYYLIAVNVAFIAWISYYYDIYIICQDTIVDIHQESFWGRKIAQLSMLRVQDVNSNIQGILPTVFGYGDVLVETAGEQSQNFFLHDMPNPQEVASKIMELHNEMVKKESRQKEHLEAEGVLSSSKIETQTEESATTQPPPPTSPSPNPSETTYQKLLAKDQPQPTRPPQGMPPPAEPVPEPKAPPREGEVSSDDLDKGGQVELK